MSEPKNVLLDANGSVVTFRFKKSMSTRYIDAKKKITKEMDGPCGRALSGYMRAHCVVKGHDQYWEPEDLRTPRFQLLRLGMIMEDELALSQAAIEQVRQGKKELEDLGNQVASLAEFVGTKLIEQIRQLRDSRMAMVREVHESLTALEDIRRFFLNDKHEQEMARLSAFTKVCRELQELKASGVLDAVSETIIRLAVEEVRR